jgi:hypothetical protein
MTKQHILDEIKRTSATNGGSPLGVKRFYAETCIKHSDRFGKFWARWSEALSEAGFSPNQMTSAYDGDVLFEKLVALARQLERFPSDGDFRLKSHNEKGFPNAKTFETRFGTKSQFISAVLEYCRRRGGYEDMIKFCETAVRRQRKPQEDTDEPRQIGFVYLFKCGRFYKIGRSNAAGRREYELAVQMPEKTEMIHEMRTDDPVGIEKYWHSRFVSKRKNGEWFDLSSADVKAFKQRKFM